MRYRAHTDEGVVMAMSVMAVCEALITSWPAVLNIVAAVPAGSVFVIFVCLCDDNTQLLVVYALFLLLHRLMACIIGVLNSIVAHMGS